MWCDALSWKRTPNQLSGQPFPIIFNHKGMGLDDIKCNTFRTLIGPCLHATKMQMHQMHDDVIKWKHFPRYWPFARGITGHRWIPRTKAIDAELWCFLWSHPNKRLSKQWWSWWFETPSCPLWRQRNVYRYVQYDLTEITFWGSSVKDRWKTPTHAPIHQCDGECLE